jgi:3-hydroxyacyl-CoA dehydrogenase
MPTARYAAHGDVAVIRLDNPPMNTLAHGLRTAVHEHLQTAASDPAIKAVVLIGSARAFCSGAEIKEFNKPINVAFPHSRDLIAAVESHPKPVVAALHGFAMGGGLELALGCHYRVAAPGTQLALPEVKLGLIPGAGGTQRLPRALGIERALDLILTGKPCKSNAVAGTLLVDQLVEGDLEAGAIAFARKVVAEGSVLRRLRDVPAKLDNAAAFFAEARKRAAKNYRGQPAPLLAIDSVEAATNRPFEDGLAFERDRFEHLLTTPESKALRHAFFGERTVAKIPDVPDDTPALDLRDVAILGAGTMGGGIAMAFADAGISVRLLEVNQAALERGLNNIRNNYAFAVSRGRMTQEEMDKRLSRIRATLSWDEIGSADAVIEAVFEDIDVKKDVFRKIDAVMKPGALLGSNTSSLDLDDIAAVTRRPQDVVGVHFFSPANVMRLVEVVRGRQTSKEMLASVMKLARALKKVAVVSGVCDGFIGNRMLDYYLRQAEYLLDEGATPQAVDKALQDWGLAMGPFAMCDLVGNDIVFHMRKRRRAELPQNPYSRIPDRLFEQGRLGQKSGSGYYRYEKGSRAPLPNPQTEQLMDEVRRAAGIKRREIGSAEIVERCIYALVNEGALILEEGIAARAVDIDMVYLTGYGFPAWRGGPMFYADTVGLRNVVAAMDQYARGYRGDFWKPAPLLARLASEGKTFN